MKTTSIVRSQTAISSSRLRLALLSCFFLSGIAGLVYEVVWSRKLTLIFGTTLYSVATILTVYMAGLAFGSFWFGRRADQTRKPLLYYALLELGIGLYALLTPLIFWGIDKIQVGLYQVFPSDYASFSAIRFVLSFVALLLPTVLMGGTLPVMAKFFVESKANLGRWVGWLYFLNTFGAVFGSLLAGFLLIFVLGATNTIFTTAALNIAIGLFVYRLQRGMEDQVGARPEPEVAETPPPETGRRRRQQRGKRVGRAEPPIPITQVMYWVLVFGVGFSGFASLSLEVSWTRVIALVLGNSVYAFSIMLATFLGGIALGSLIVTAFIDRQRNLWMFFVIFEVLIGGSIVLFSALLDKLPFLFLQAWEMSDGSFWVLQPAEMLLTAMVMIVPTTLMGAVLPLAIKIYTRDLQILGRSVGDLYFSNTIGALAGSFLTGFLLIPNIGMQASTYVAAGIYVAVGSLAALVAPVLKALIRWPSLGLAAAVMVATVLLPRWDIRVLNSGVFVLAEQYARSLEQGIADQALRSGVVLFYKESLTAAVMVKQIGNSLSLIINGKADASTTSADMDTQLLLGHLPILLNPGAKNVLVVGMGSGVTTGAISLYPVEQIDLVEIEPAVVQAAAYFKDYNHNVLEDKRLRIITNDARNFIAATQRKYDAISAEPSNPWIKGVSNLFAKEQFELYKSRLNDDGIMVQWMHLYSMSPDDFRMVAATFRSVFPYTIMWANFWGTDVFLIGSKKPLTIDVGKLIAQMEQPEIKADLARMSLDDPFTLLSYFAMDQETIDRFSAGSRLHTDDRPILEYTAPRSLFADTVSQNLDVLKNFQSSVMPLLVNFRLPGKADTTDVRSEFESQLKKYGNSRQLVFDGEQTVSQRGLIEGIKIYEKAVDTNPKNIQAKAYLAEMLYLLGNSYYEAGAFQEAIDRYKKAIEVKPDYLVARKAMAFAYGETNNNKKAIEILTEIVDMDPNDISSMVALGAYYQMEKEPDKAEAQLKKALALDPTHYLARNYLAEVYADKKMYYEAVQEFERSILTYGNQPEVKQRLQELRRLL